ncbi:hypothetical protein SAMN05421788_10767 [Filimonas lacunae]|uniref:Uncharacterized protein n=1 Tax=Filimonas lacunae TaxID=477680 RepID=A0A173MFL5_9BACT|nr:hypothetical protein [Filimonas lacunae]BAV06412.1 hypothetical protein FLA_2429 [Filimonas lacunae]SIT26857.1 hypothetical protein SAMN05421788_10767 [Filimonas lacunae]
MIRFLGAMLYLLLVNSNPYKELSSIITRQQSIAPADTASATPATGSYTPEPVYDYQSVPFTAIKQYPLIKDSAAFIKALQENCHIYTLHHHRVTINYFKKVKFYGSDLFYYLLEYDFHDGSNASFPWKDQYLFTISGKLVTRLRTMRLSLLRIFPDAKPFLFGVSATAKGNGWHEIYRINKDTVEQLMEQFRGNRPLTYDGYDDNDINSPFEFAHTCTDQNLDGYNDIVFTGTIRYSSVDMSSIYDKSRKVKLTFLYHPETGHFVPMEDYSKKYAYIYGETW